MDNTQNVEISLSKYDDKYRDYLEKAPEYTNREKVYICPACKDTIKISRGKFYGQCKACGLHLLDYKPAPHQEAFHKSKARFRLNIGGFGSGKTTMCCAEIAKHVLSVPNGRTLLTAPTLRQVKDAVIPELIKFLPPSLIQKQTSTPSFFFRMYNGHEIVVYASNDEENLRSLNLTAFYIEEASNVDETIFTQLQARLRNESALVYNEIGEVVDDLSMGIICSNPEDAWFREKFMFVSSLLHCSKSINKQQYLALLSPNPIADYHTFISSTRDNTYLPERFLMSLLSSKSMTWVSKYIDCNLGLREGSVYPDFLNHVIEPFEIPKHWQRIAGFDKGFADQTTLIVGAIDPITSVIYFYDEYYVNEQPISYHAQHIAPMVKDYDFYQPIQADPTVANRNERDGTSYQAYFYQVCGVWLACGANDIVMGIDKLRDYMYLGKVKFFTTLENLKKEMISYVYKDGKPIDKNNHLLDALRYSIARLPSDPKIFNISRMVKLNVNHLENPNSIHYNNKVEANIYISGGASIWQKDEQQEQKPTSKSFWD